MHEYELIANLITDVLSSKINAKEALDKFPKNNQDINIKCAFDALMHYEADEDLRKNVQDYALVQDEYLENIAQILKKNKQLPQNIINEYLKYHKDNILAYNKKGFRGFIEYIKRMINF
ncbi:MAG: hypothetical protein IJ877_07065 [Candidatus Gastranaerophilales bacterium]|nr:hypothetical protein [Candidatus Gastranaerophilales bacterium]